MKNIKRVFLLLLAVNFHYAIAQTNYPQPTEIRLQGDLGWDYLTVDEISHRLFVSHGNQVNVVDLNTNTQVGLIQATLGVHGIAIATELNKGYTSNGKDSSITVFDLKTLAEIKKVSVSGKNPDAILFEPNTKRIFTFNGKGKNISVFDAVTDQLISTIEIGGKPEFAVHNGKGLVYFNVEDKNKLMVLNAKSMKIEQTFSVQPGDEPTGLAIDILNKRLFSVCGNKTMVVINAETGRMIASVPIGDGCDGVVYDAEKHMIFASNGEGTISVIAQKNADTYEVAGTLPSAKGARTIALETRTHKLYLPTANSEEPTGDNKRGKLIPGTFRVLVFDELKDK